MNGVKDVELALYLVADRLGPLRTRVVFVGGAVRGLLTVDPGGPEARPTDDVDVIVEVSTYGEYHDFEMELHAQGFTNDARPGAPLCRFLHGELVLDVMPVDSAALGFTNRWYEHAVATAEEVTVRGTGDAELAIRVVNAVSFVATKLEAFAARGEGDVEHRDVEDIVALVDGRARIVDEVRREAESVRAFIREGLDRLFDLGLDDKLRWHLAGDASGDARLPILRARLRDLARAPV